MALSRKGRMRRENRVQARDEGNHVVGRVPPEVVLAVNVDLLATVPFDAVRDAPGALPGKECRELHAQPRIDVSALRQTVVVMRLGEVHERAVLLGACDRLR